MKESRRNRDKERKIQRKGSKFWMKGVHFFKKLSMTKKRKGSSEIFENRRMFFKKFDNIVWKYIFPKFLPPQYLWPKFLPPQYLWQVYAAVYMYYIYDENMHVCVWVYTKNNGPMVTRLDVFLSPALSFSKDKAFPNIGMAFGPGILSNSIWSFLFLSHVKIMTTTAIVKRLVNISILSDSVEVDFL